MGVLVGVLMCLEAYLLDLGLLIRGLVLSMEANEEEPKEVA